MAIYEAKIDQTIFDIAVQLYGSIEGAFDLLMSNPGLSINDDIPRGTTLNYHENFIINQEISKTLQTSPPSSVPHNVYYKTPTSPCVMLVMVPSILNSGSFSVSGDGEMVIDWGDNSALESIVLSSQTKTIEHYYDNTLHIASRMIRVYGYFNIQHIDLSNMNGEFYPTREIVVDEFSYNKYSGSMWGVMLFKGLNVLRLTHSMISTLDPISGLNLQILDLSNSIISEQEFESYLECIVTHYGDRRDCTVTAHVSLTDKAMEYIRLIVQNPDWNSNGQWSFNINGIVYDNQYDWPEVETKV